MMDWYGAMGAGGWILMTLFWVIVIALVVWVAVRLFPTRATRSNETAERPEELLDRRLARGEIDPETYDKLREKLQLSRTERR